MIIGEEELDRMETEAELHARKLIDEFTSEWNAPKKQPPIVIEGTQDGNEAES